MQLVLARWQWAPGADGTFGWQKPGGDYTGGCVDLRSRVQAGSPGPAATGVGLFAYDTLPAGYTRATDPGNIGAREYVDVGDDPLARTSVAHRNALADALGHSRLVLSDATLTVLLGEQIMGSLADPTGSLRVKPLKMNRRGVEVVLKGFGEVYSHPLDAAHPCYAQTLAVRRADYATTRAKLLARVRARGLADDVALDICRRWTGWDIRELGASLTDLVPLAHLADGYLLPSTTLTEPWLTNSTTLSTGQNEPWTEDQGDHEVQAGVLTTNTTTAGATFSGAAYASCDTALSSDDHEHSATAAVAAVEAGARVLVRYNATIATDVPDDCYLTQYYRESGFTRAELRKYVSGAFTTLDNLDTDRGSPVSIDCAANGSTITGNVGVTSFSETDTGVTGHLQCGVSCARTSGTANSDATLDDHTMADLVAGDPEARVLDGGKLVGGGLLLRGGSLVRA